MSSVRISLALCTFRSKNFALFLQRKVTDYFRHSYIFPHFFISSQHPTFPTCGRLPVAFPLPHREGQGGGARLRPPTILETKASPPTPLAGERGVLCDAGRGGGLERKTPGRPLGAGVCGYRFLPLPKMSAWVPVR